MGANFVTLFIPTTANPAGEQFICTAVGANLTTTCTGTTVGDPLLGATVTVDFPQVGGGFSPATGTIFGPALNLPVPTANPALTQAINSNNRQSCRRRRHHSYRHRLHCCRRRLRRG